MIGERAYDAIASIRIDRDKLVWATPTAVYKLFWGYGGADRQPQEAAASKAASECRIWGRHCLPVKAARLPRLLRSQRGAALDDTPASNAALQAFLDCRLREAAAGSRPAPALELMELRKLKAAFGVQEFERVMNGARPALARLVLPAGPVHGDLHRGNIVSADGQFFLIDWDRYNPMSSPFFDKLHFLLTRRRQHHHIRWVPLLKESEDLVVRARSLFGLHEASAASLALAYGFNRIALESYDASLKRQNLSRFSEFAMRLIATFGERAVMEGEGRGC